MKSLLVTSGTAGTNLETLARGAWAIVWDTGEVKTSLPDKGMYKYVVGLGDGNVISGLWLNVANKVPVKRDYNAGAVKTVTVTDFAVNTNLTSEATLHIQTQPKNAFSGNTYQEFVATVPIISTTQTSASVEADMLVQVTELVAEINKYFGKTVISITTDSPTGIKDLTFAAGDTDFNFYVNFGGAASGKTTETNTLSFGTQAEVIELEKEMAIATFGYNPNFDAGDNPYGDVLLANEFGASGYDVIVITSTAPATDQMPLHPDGAKVEQWIAVPTGNSTLVY